MLPEHNDSLKHLSNFSTPIATGERMYSRYDYKSLLAEGYVDIIQPDLSHAGGITECKRLYLWQKLMMLQRHHIAHWDQLL